ncbi:MAG: TIGR03790 family protein, partial [Flavobacteriales bacterium]|nr:TIGR03790 family protein [Flavobacteriales bacterium]
MNKFFCSLTALFFSVISIAQEDVNYDDVAVIMNNNSSTSILIGEYFQEKRSIPDINMIYIDVPVEEVIDSAQFELMRSQIEEYITGNNLQDSLNYLVTTKGVPLRIEYGECEATTGGGPFDFPKCSSVDSELALMLEEYSDFINENGGLMNIYYEETNHFSRDEYGLYLVTRLSGHDIWDVKSLINRSGPNTPVADFGSNYVFDSFNWDMSGDSAWAADILAPAHDYVVAQGWNSVLATEVDFLTEQESVFGYYCVSATGNADTDSPDNVWVKGSVATVFVESSASTFNYDGADDRLLLADYIAEGACGGFGLAN